MWEPWAILTVAANGAGRIPAAPAKGVETRHFAPRFPLPIPVAIHATKRWNGDLAALLRSWPFDECLKRGGYSIEDPRLLKGARDLSNRKPIPLGALIGVATIVEVVPAPSLVASWSRFEDGAAERYAEEVHLGNYKEGRFGWVLADARELPEPIPYSGRQDVLYALAPELDAQIDEQLATVAA